VAILAGLFAFAVPAYAGTQSISGTVTDSADNPVVDFCVTATRYTTSGSFILLPARTGSDGTFSITGPAVEPGTYTLEYAVCQNGATGPASNFDLIPEYWEDQPNVSSADRFAIGEGEAVTGKDAVLQIGARISGTISGPDGPMTGCVTLYGPGVSAGIQTAPNGSYTYRKLRPGEYRLRFSDCSNPPQLAAEWYSGKATRAQATVINLTDAEVLSGVDVSLAPGGTIAGTVTGPDTAAVESICVTAYDADSAWVASSSTDASGQFTLSALFPAAYRLFYADCNHRSNVASEYFENAAELGTATEILVTAEQASQASAQLARGGSISGVVRGPDQLPLADACVTAYDALGDSYSYTDTAADGSYRLGSLETGDYRVEFRTCGAIDGDDVEEFWRDQPTLNDADPIAVTLGQDIGQTNATLGAPDPVTPDTTIASGPAAGGRLSVAKTKFSFRSSIPGSTFECRLDGGGWKPCVSPRTLTGLRDGAHTFAVRATSPALLIDETPASRTFRVAVAPCQEARAELTRARTQLAAAKTRAAKAGRRLKAVGRVGSATRVSAARRKLKEAMRIRRVAERRVRVAQSTTARRCRSAAAA
jgi:hypothetical protein